MVAWRGARSRPRLRHFRCNGKPANLRFRRCGRGTSHALDFNDSGARLPISGRPAPPPSQSPAIRSSRRCRSSKRWLRSRSTTAACQGSRSRSSTRTKWSTSRASACARQASRRRSDADTVFQIASLSKPVSATVVAALVSEGIVEWSSRIADLYPAFALKDPYPTQQLTVRDLFNHRSGLPGNAGDDLEDIGFGRDEVMHRLQAGAALVELPRRLCLFQRGPHGRRARRRHAHRKILGGCGRGEALQAARHGADLVALCRFPGAGEPLGAAYRRRRQVGGEAEARRNRAGAGRRRQRVGARPDQLDAARACQRQVSTASS